MISTKEPGKEPGAKKAACPTCGKPSDPAMRPFCSKRCADIDLGRWLNERYVVTQPIEPDESSDIKDDEPG